MNEVVRYWDEVYKSCPNKKSSDANYTEVGMRIYSCKGTLPWSKWNFYIFVDINSSESSFWCKQLREEKCFFFNYPDQLEGSIIDLSCYVEDPLNISPEERMLLENTFPHDKTYDMKYYGDLVMRGDSTLAVFY